MVALSEQLPSVLRHQGSSSMVLMIQRVIFQSYNMSDSCAQLTKIPEAILPTSILGRVREPGYMATYMNRGSIAVYGLKGNLAAKRYRQQEWMKPYFDMRKYPLGSLL